jgi:hypothetical protein
VRDYLLRPKETIQFRTDPLVTITNPNEETVHLRIDVPPEVKVLRNLVRRNSKLDMRPHDKIRDRLTRAN